jgi:hypothetical protein
MLRLLTLTTSSHLLEEKMRDHVASVGISIVDKFEANPKKVYTERLEKGAENEQSKRRIKFSDMCASIFVLYRM